MDGGVPTSADAAPADRRQVTGGAQDGGGARVVPPADAALEVTVVDGGGAAPPAGAPPAPAIPAVPAVPAIPEPPGPAVAQVPLSIRVLEKGSRRSLAGAAVTIDAIPAGETAEDGRLVVSTNPGDHQLEVQLPGYAPQRQPVRATTAPGEDEVIFRLSPQSDGERYETKVRAGRAELPALSVPAEEARQTAGTSGDPLRVVASLPGVSQVAWPAAIFVIRGSNPGNTGFFIDGIRVPAMFHLALGPSIIHPNLIGGLDFYPGAFPESFGRYVAGIVSVRTTAPPTDRAHMAATVTLYDAGGIATAPVNGGKGVVTAAARYSYTGPLLSLFDASTKLRYGDYQLRLDHQLWGGRATVFAFGSLDQLQWGTPAGETIETAALQFHRLDFRWVGVVAGGRFTAGITLGLDRARSTLYRAPIAVSSLDLAPRIFWARPLRDNVDLELGADAELQRFDARPAPFQGRQSDLARSRNALSQGTFAAVRLRLGSRLLIAPGVRADLFAEEGTTRFVVQPRLNARFVVTPLLSLKANAGRFTQMPSLPVNVAGFEAFGLGSIGLQRSDAVSGGIDARFPGTDTQIDVTGFYQRMRVTDIRNLDISQMMPTRDDYLALREGVGYGVELLVRRPSRHRTYGWLAYTLAWSLRNVDGAVARSDWDQRHILNLVAGRRLGGGYTVGARVHLHTGRNVPLYDAAGSYRQIPTYYQVDLRAERRFLFDKFLLDLFIDVANATFKRELLQYVATATGPQPAYLRLILPTIGIRGEF